MEIPSFLNATTLYFLIQIAGIVFLAGVIYFKKKNSISFNGNFRIPSLSSQDFLPRDQIHTLKQLFYLLMVVFFILLIIVYCSNLFNSSFWFQSAVIDVICSLIAINSILSDDNCSYIHLIPLFFLIPYVSLTFLLFGDFLQYIPLDMFFIYSHGIGIIYAIYFFTVKFYQYTKNHNLALTIVILILIVYGSLILTMLAESKSILDAMCMVTNAFTSNGYAVLGSSAPGKIDSLLLTWGGYILSGVGTATLAAAILKRYFDNRLNSIEEKYEKQNQELLSKMDELIRKQD